MAKGKVVKDTETGRDLDVTIIVRSSQLKLTELREFNRRLIDFLSTQPEVVLLVSEDMLVQRDIDRNLITLTSKLVASK